MTAPRHFLTLMDLAPDEIRALIARAIELKMQHRAGTAPARPREAQLDPGGRRTQEEASLALSGFLLSRVSFGSHLICAH